MIHFTFRTPHFVPALAMVCAFSGVAWLTPAQAADQAAVAQASVQHYRPSKPALRSDKLKLVLKPEQQAEVKMVLAEGDAVVYSWTSKGVPEGDLYVDFHGHTVAVPGKDENVVRYSEGEHLSGKGAIVAPLTGDHGWYFLNMGTKPVTIELQVHGFHAKLGKNMLTTQSGK
jgi:hypothetical protein